MLKNTGTILIGKGVAVGTVGTAAVSQLVKLSRGFFYKKPSEQGKEVKA